MSYAFINKRRVIQISDTKELSEVNINLVGFWVDIPQNVDVVVNDIYYNGAFRRENITIIGSNNNISINDIKSVIDDLFIEIKNNGDIPVASSNTARYKIIYTNLTRSEALQFTKSYHIKAANDLGIENDGLSEAEIVDLIRNFFNIE